MTDYEAAAWSVLDDIHDPCSLSFGCPLSLVEMGLVKAVDYEADGITVTLQLTEPTCMYTFRITQEVSDQLGARLGEDVAVEVRLSHDPLTIWTEDRIDPDARERLTRARRRRLIEREPHPTKGRRT